MSNVNMQSKVKNPGRKHGLGKIYWLAKKLNGGPGGWHCPCCNPYGRATRFMKAKAHRLVRRILKIKDSTNGSIDGDG